MDHCCQIKDCQVPPIFNSMTIRLCYAHYHLLAGMVKAFEAMHPVPLCAHQGCFNQSIGIDPFCLQHLPKFPFTDTTGLAFYSSK